MSSLTTYNGLQIASPGPRTVAGKATNDNFKKLSTVLSASDPGSADDSTEGFGIGSRWINTASKIEFVCTDPTPAAAVWQSAISPAGGSSTNIQFNNGGSFGGNANLVWDNANGFMGIGTSVPAHFLDIQSTVDTGDQPAGLGMMLSDSQSTPRVGGVFLGGGNDFVLGTYSNHRLTIVSNNGIHASFWIEPSTDDICFVTVGPSPLVNNTPNFVIQGGTGYVGIGTASPAFMCDVNGDGNFSGNVTVAGNVVIDGSLTYSTSDPELETFYPISVSRAVELLRNNTPKSKWGGISLFFNKDRNQFEAIDHKTAKIFKLSMVEVEQLEDVSSLVATSPVEDASAVIPVTPNTNSLRSMGTTDRRRGTGAGNNTSSKFTPN